MPEVAISRAGGLSNTRFQGFEVAAAGDGHFAKHGAEFNAPDKAAYIRKAKAYGEANGEYLEAMIGNTFIRVDPDVAKNRRVFVANGAKIRTFYVWNPAFSADPFAYAIYYTITHNLRIPITGVEPATHKLLQAQGVDLVETQVDYIIKSFLAQKSVAEICSETLAPQEYVQNICDQLTAGFAEIMNSGEEMSEMDKMIAGLSTPKKMSKPLTLL